MSSAHVNGVADAIGEGNGAGPDLAFGGEPLHSTGAASRRPEVAVGAAFLGGFLLALLLRRVRS